MNIMCYKVEKSLVEALALKLIPKGFHVLPAETVFELKKTLYTKNIKLIIADISSDKTKDNIDIEFVKWLRMIDQKNDYKKIIFSSITDEFTIRRLMEMGITSFISKKNPTSTILEKVEAIISKINFDMPEARRYVRVAPDKSENPVAIFYIGDNKITGRIVNISMGGVLVAVQNPSILYHLRKDQELSRIQLSLNHKKIILNALVVLTKHNMLALKFSEMSDNYKESLSKYIFNKISST